MRKEINKLKKLYFNLCIITVQLLPQTCNTSKFDSLCFLLLLLEPINCPIFFPKLGTHYALHLLLPCLIIFYTKQCPERGGMGEQEREAEGNKIAGGKEVRWLLSAEGRDWVYVTWNYLFSFVNLLKLRLTI